MASSQKNVDRDYPSIGGLRQAPHANNTARRGEIYTRARFIYTGATLHCNVPLFINPPIHDGMRRRNTEVPK